LQERREEMNRVNHRRGTDTKIVSDDERKVLGQGDNRSGVSFSIDHQLIQLVGQTHTRAEREPSA